MDKGHNSMDNILLMCGESSRMLFKLFFTSFCLANQMLVRTHSTRHGERSSDCRPFLIGSRVSLSPVVQHDDLRPLALYH